MKYIILAIIIFIIIIWIYYFIKRRWVIKKVKEECLDSKINSLNTILCPFGFAYCPEQDIIISKEDSWQRNLGFHDIVDLSAPFFNIVMDAETIYFNYNNKRYRLELWKGQYGITTGAEVGLYVREHDSKLPKNYYRCANSDEEIEISFSLYKKCLLLCRCDKTWWCTGFDVGMFSKPKDLSLDVCINFPCEEMHEAFIQGLIESGYSESKINVCCDSVCIDYCSPKNYKLNHKHKIIKCFAQMMNCLNCKIYNRFTRHFNTTLDKLTYIKYMMPLLFKKFIKLITCRKEHEKDYCKKSKKVFKNQKKETK